MLLQAVAISLEDEGAIVSFSEKSGAGGNTTRCTICNRLGHMASKCVSKDRFPPANAQAVMSFMSSFKCGRAGQIARENCRQKSNKGTCGPRGHAEECHPGTTSVTREQGRSMEAACGFQKKKWIRAGNERQELMCNLSSPRTGR